MNRNPFLSFITLNVVNSQIDLKIEKHRIVQQELHNLKLLLAKRDGILVESRQKMRFVGELVEFGFRGDVSFLFDMTHEEISAFIRTYRFEGRVVSPTEIIGAN